MEVNRQRERHERMAVLFASHCHMAKCEKFADLPIHIQEVLIEMQYKDIVLPLMCQDRYRNGLSYRQLSIKYGIPRSSVCRMLLQRHIKGVPK